MSNNKRARGRTDREQVIDWLKADLQYYKNNIGEVKEHGKTIKGNMSRTTIDQALIDTVEERIKKLKEKELKEV